MNADTALPMSKGNDAGIIQKTETKSFPDDEIRGIFRNAAFLTGKYKKRIKAASSIFFASNIKTGDICPATLSRNNPDFTCTGGK